MWNAAFIEFILSWQQCTVSRPCTDPFLKATLPSSHDMRKKTVKQTLQPLSDVKIIVATGNTTVVATMVVAE